jgi:hypothetical protein
MSEQSNDEIVAPNQPSSHSDSEMTPLPSQPPDVTEEPVSRSDSVPSFYEPHDLKLTPSQEMLVKLAEAKMEEKNFVLKQQIKK